MCGGDQVDACCSVQIRQVDSQSASSQDPRRAALSTRVVISAKTASISMSVLAGACLLCDSVHPDVTGVAQQPQVVRVRAVAVDVVDLGPGGGAQHAEAAIPLDDVVTGGAEQVPNWESYPPASACAILIYAGLARRRRVVSLGRRWQRRRGTPAPSWLGTCMPGSSRGCL